MRRTITLPERAVAGPFSDAVLVGNTLYISGKIGVDPATGSPPAEPEAEARLALEWLKAVLAEAGMTIEDLVTVQIFCPDVSLFDRFNRVYRSYFGADLPARAFIGSGPLLRGGRFQLTAIAARDRE